MSDPEPRCQACGLPFEVECAVEALDLAGTTYLRVPLGSESPEWWLGHKPHEVCHDCGARTGQRHHFMCDMEQCPRCKNQLLTCDCD